MTDAEMDLAAGKLSGFRGPEFSAFRDSIVAENARGRAARPCLPYIGQREESNLGALYDYGARFYSPYLNLSSLTI